MAFFDEIDTFDLLEANAEQLFGLENMQAERMAELFRKVRLRLQANLRRLAEQGRSDTFTAQQQRQVLIQLDAAIRAMAENIQSGISLSAEELAASGVDDLISETEAFSEFFTGALQPINIDAALVASESSNFLINQYEASISAYSENLRNRIAGGLAEMVVEPTSLSSVVDRLGEFFGGEEWQVLRIARTELHNIYSSSKIAGLRALGQDTLPGIKKTLYHPRDSRTAADSQFLIAHAKRMVKSVDDPFDYWWTNKGGPNGKGHGSLDGPNGIGRWYHRVFQNPPDRPNDRAILIPYHPTWDN